MKKSCLFVLLLTGCAASAPKNIELGEPVAQFESAKESKTVLNCVRREWVNMKWRTCSAAQPIVLDTEQGTDLYAQMVVDGSWSVITGIDHEPGSTIAIHIDKNSAMGCNVQTPFEEAIRRCK
ncbi:MAG: hypothetical protein JSW48_01690 [Betaproteobacteria bacterium]|nr:MAG: hypothetical protein JSW48_01690 [Betaproteobacteria bacterium]